MSEILDILYTLSLIFMLCFLVISNMRLYPVTYLIASLCMIIWIMDSGGIIFSILFGLFGMNYIHIYMKLRNIKKSNE